MLVEVLLCSGCPVFFYNFLSVSVEDSGCGWRNLAPPRILKLLLKVICFRNDMVLAHKMYEVERRFD